MRGLVVCLALSSILIGGCSSSSAPSWTYAPSGPPVAGSAGSAAPSEPAEPATASGTIAIEAFDLGFTPAQASIETPGPYTVTLANTGQAPHDITFADGTTVAAAPGETASVEVDVPASGLAFVCSIPGHEQGGMTGSIVVAGETAAASPAASHDDHGGPAPVTSVEADPRRRPRSRSIPSLRRASRARSTTSIWS